MANLQIIKSTNHVFLLMSLHIASLNSGSNANCYYIGNRHDAVLVDAGLSCRETEKRMDRLGLSMANVKAIFISHEHSDHITGLAGISKKHQLPVYITDATLRSMSMPVEKHLIHSFKAGVPVPIGKIRVTPFQKSHDARDPHSFIVSENNINIGVLTDIGHGCKDVLHYFKQCYAVFLESNYCDEMLENGDYPAYLKKRISSDQGHLSNAQALEIFNRYRSPQLRLLILSHLSKNNNKPELVESLFNAVAGETRIVVASRYEETEVFEIRAEEGMDLLRPRYVYSKKQQLSLF